MERQHPSEWQPFFIKTRRHLPHWELQGSTYFITWRCAQGVQLEPPERQIVADAIRYWDSQRYLLFAGTVMPDHVHLLLKLEPDQPAALSKVIHSLKSFTANNINQLRARHGSVWQNERFDRIVRDEKEFAEKLQYIVTNAQRRELALDPLDYPWLLLQEQ